MDCSMRFSIKAYCKGIWEKLSSDCLQMLPFFSTTPALTLYKTHQRINWHYNYLCIGSILCIGVHPSIADANPLQILGIDWVTFNNDSGSGRNIMASCSMCQRYVCVCLCVCVLCVCVWTMSCLQLRLKQVSDKASIHIGIVLLADNNYQLISKGVCKLWWDGEPH